MRPACGFTSGFTLLEMLVVIVIVSVGLAGLGRMFGNTAMGLANAEDMQNAAAYAQQCAEIIIGTRRDRGFNAVSSSLCGPAPAGYARTVTLGTAYSGSGPVACPAGATCRDVQVAVSKGSAASDLSFLLVQ
jgi:prepilin-type N-terminal cleavage/methylation domain-containing protein